MGKIVLVMVFLHNVIAQTVYGNPVNNSLLPELCGIDTTDRIFGGKTAKVGEFPWIALLQREGANFTCGGVLISKRYVLTAAHCSGKIPIINVRLGEHNLETEEDCDISANLKIKTNCAPKPIDIGVEKIIRHYQYSRKRTNNTHDITLIRLEKDVKFTKYIKPICLPMKEIEEAGVGRTAIVAGWGQTETKVVSPSKLKLEVPIKPNDKCWLPSDAKQICAGGDEGKDSCAGDSGGPLMVKIDNDEESNWYIIGIVSFGRALCATAGVPSVYTKVGDYVQWIVDNLEP